MSIPLSSSLLALFPIRFLALFPIHQRAFHNTGKAAPIPAPTHISEVSVPSPFTALKRTVSLAPSNPLLSIFHKIGAFCVNRSTFPQALLRSQATRSAPFSVLLIKFAIFGKIFVRLAPTFVVVFAICTPLAQVLTIPHGIAVCAMSARVFVVL